MALTVQLRKKLGSFLLDVELCARSGEPLALLGASGCGKSMTLKCIAGVERPDWGRIVLDEKVLFDSERRINLPPQERRIGYLFQQYALFPHMTVAQNIAAGARRIKPARRAEAAARLIAALHLEGLEALRPRQLSGGQQQRAALARILASEPRVLLLDEPLSALDSQLKWQLELELQDILEEFQGPVIWVSHDRDEVCRSCAQVSVLHQGRSAPAAGILELMSNPGTVSAARLSGCKNYVPIKPGPRPGTVAVPVWGLILETAAPLRENASILGLRTNQIRPAFGEAVNTFPCQVVRVRQDAFSVLAALRPIGGEAEGPLLWMELNREQWEALPDRNRLQVSIQPEHLLLLEDA